MPNYLEAQQQGQTREKGVQNFLKAITNLGDIQGNEVRLKSQLLANQFEKKQNFLYKIQEKLQQNQMTQDMVTKMRTGQENNGFGIGSPEVRAGEGGEAKVYYPSTRDKEFAIKQGWARVKAKQGKGMQLSPSEVKFTEMYPEEMLGGKETINQPFVLNKGVEIPEGYERVGYDSKGNPMVRKIGVGKEEKKITTAQALNIISDPFKSQQLKRYYPELYKQVESIAKRENIQDISKNNLDEKALPEGITEEDIQHTLKLHPEYTRESLIDKITDKK